jgi:hypothetical protein
MIYLSNNQDLSAASGIVNMPFLEHIYHSMMDEMMQDMGRTVVFHLKPQIQQDANTQSQPQAQQYNPFFGRTPVPKTNTRNPGTKITHRDVEYKAQIVLGPLRAGEDTEGVGPLLEDEGVITVVIEALPHVTEAISVSIEGRRYSIEQTRPVGLSKRRYLMVKIKEIQELEPPTTDNTIG